MKLLYLRYQKWVCDDRPQDKKVIRGFRGFASWFLGLRRGGFSGRSGSEPLFLGSFIDPKPEAGSNVGFRSSRFDFTQKC
jgi:hypothetical protein